MLRVIGDYSPTDNHYNRDSQLAKSFLEKFPIFPKTTSMEGVLALKNHQIVAKTLNLAQGRGDLWH